MQGVKGTGHFSRKSGQNSQYSTQHYKENRLKYIERAKEYQKAHPEKTILKSAKARAKEKGFEFNLEESDIIIPKICPLLGTEITFIQGQGNVWTNASIDRIDSSKGYVKGNIEIMSRLANMMKQFATQEQLITFAKNILRKYT